MHTLDGPLLKVWKHPSAEKKKPTQQSLNPATLFGYILFSTWFCVEPYTPGEHKKLLVILQDEFFLKFSELVYPKSKFLQCTLLQWKSLPSVKGETQDEIKSIAEQLLQMGIKQEKNKKDGKLKLPFQEDFCWKHVKRIETFFFFLNFG